MIIETRVRLMTEHLHSLTEERDLNKLLKLRELLVCEMGTAVILQGC